MSARFDMAIVGGGLVGLALAWGMRSLGERLVVVDAGDARSASQANFGLVWVQGKGADAPAYAGWTLRSSRAWPQLAAELGEASGVDVAWQQTGGLHVCLSVRELDARVARLDRLFAQHGVERYEVAVHTRAELLARLPMLGADVAGGSFSPLDGHCNPLRLHAALRSALGRRGVALRTPWRVDAIEPSDAGFRLLAAADSLDTARVVVAAGRATQRLAPMVGLEIPLVADTGEVLVLERMRPFLPFALETIRQTDDGAVLLGDSHEPRDDDALDLAVMGAIARRAQRVFPALARARVVRAWAAARVVTPDGLPIYAQSPAHAGAFAVACHSGVTLAAAHAYDVAPAILSAALPDALAPFSAARFHRVRAAA